MAVKIRNPPCLLNIATEAFFLFQRKSELGDLLLSQDSFRTGKEGIVSFEPLPKTSLPTPFASGWASAPRLFGDN
jgi:hypothetical protein